MLNNPLEYDKMFKAQQKHWWYRTLHHLTLKNIQNYSPDVDITIVDAGCGTGGGLLYLRDQGYKNPSGIDISDYAVKLSQSSGLNVFTDSVINIDKYYTAQSLNVIICNDVLYFFSSEERKTILQKFYSLLKPGGIVIFNLPAFNLFRGTHDISVGIKKRFKKTDFTEMLNGTGFNIQKMLYWPFFLSFVIAPIRFFQRLRLKINSNLEFESDVDVPPVFVNEFCYYLTKWENTIFPLKPFGSSLFIVLRKPA